MCNVIYATQKLHRNYCFLMHNINDDNLQRLETLTKRKKKTIPLNKYIFSKRDLVEKNFLGNFKQSRI